MRLEAAEDLRALDVAMAAQSVDGAKSLQEKLSKRYGNPVEGNSKHRLLEEGDHGAGIEKLKALGSKINSQG